MPLASVAACSFSENGSMPEQPEERVATPRRVLCRLGMKASVRLAKLSISLLPAHHPYRVFVGSIIADFEGLPRTATASASRRGLKAVARRIDLIDAPLQ